MRIKNYIILIVLSIFSLSACNFNSTSRVVDDGLSGREFSAEIVRVLEDGNKKLLLEYAMHRTFLESMYEFRNVVLDEETVVALNEDSERKKEIMVDDLLSLTENIEGDLSYDFKGQSTFLTEEKNFLFGIVRIDQFGDVDLLIDGKYLARLLVFEFDDLWYFMVR